MWRISSYDRWGSIKEGLHHGNDRQSSKKLCKPTTLKNIEHICILGSDGDADGDATKEWAAFFKATYIRKWGESETKWQIHFPKQKPVKMASEKMPVNGMLSSSSAQLHPTSSIPTAFSCTF